MKYKPHEDLIDMYLKQGFLPYKSDFDNPEITTCREFEIIFTGGLCRYDVMFINDSDQRYDIIDFKSRPLMLKDAYQIYRYMKAFLYNQIKGNIFNPDYKFCFHLIGRDWDDERIDNLVMVDSIHFKIHVYYQGVGLDVYEQDIFNIQSLWI
jgi:hypothetical protein